MYHNARFKVFVNGGEVVLTVRPGQSVRWHKSEPTDEGYHFEDVTWYLDQAGEVLYREGVSGGRDCDGQLENYYEDSCPIVTHEGESTLVDGWPQWGDRKESVYDQYAQAAGY